MTYGIILAAGAGTRMGTEKALLRLADGRTLLEDQIVRMAEGGVDKIYVVVGCNAEKIMRAISNSLRASRGESRSGQVLDSPPEADRSNNIGARTVIWIENKDWELGSFSSVQCGLKDAGQSAALVLPVDAAGVDSGTIAKIIEKGINWIPPPLLHGGHGAYTRRNDRPSPAFAGMTSFPTHGSMANCCNIVPTFNGQGGHPVFLRPETIGKILETPADNGRLDEILKADPQTKLLEVADKNILNNINTPEEWDEYCLGIVQR